VITIIVLIVWAFDTVEPIEWGLKYNKITKDVFPEKSLYFLDYYLYLKKFMKEEDT
jgi:hypothetical protein